MVIKRYGIGIIIFVLMMGVVLVGLAGVPTTDYLPADTTVNDVAGAQRSFNVSSNQSINATWKINGTEVQNNTNVDVSNYPNASAVLGSWNISVTVWNENMIVPEYHEWFWNVTSASSPSGDSTPNVTSLTAVNITDTSAVIQFSINQSDAKTRVYYGTTNALGTWSNYNNVSGLSRTIQLSGLTNGTTYYYSVFAYNGSNQSYSDNTSIQNFITLNPTTPNITDVTTDNPKASSVNITFSVNQSDAKTVVYYGTTDALGTWSNYNNVSGLSRTIMLSGLSNGTTYYYSVYAYNGSNQSYNTNSTVFNFTTKYPAPAISSTSPSSPWTTTGSTSVNFTISFDQIVDVTWLKDGSPISGAGNNSVTSASYLSTNPPIGTWNITAVGNNTNGTASYSWNWTVRSKTYLQGNRIWDGSKPDLFSTTYTWNPMSFPGFYYDAKSDVGNENIIITLDSHSDRTIDKGDIVYETTPEEVVFGYSAFGSYQVIGFMADKYFAGYNTTPPNARPSVNFADKNALGQGQLHRVLMDDGDQRTVSVGGTLTLKNGYVLKATDIDSSARTMLISLLKDGSEVDTTPLSAGETYVYTKKVGAVSDLPIVIVRFDNVFSGREVQAAFLKGIFQIDENPTKIKTGDTYGVMEITSVGKDKIEMVNKNSVDLSAGTTKDIMGDLKIVVADNSSVVRYALSVEKTGNFEVRSSVYREEDPITEWTPYNFGLNIGKTSIGFYYSLDDGIGNESLRLASAISSRTIADQGLVYTTTPQDVSFERSEFGSYQVIGFRAEKYFAGYKNTIANTRPSVNFADKNALGQGQLHKVLTDDNDQRTISVGSTLTLKEGYVLKATDIDTTARIMLISLLKDGSEVDTTPLSAGETYVYTKKVGAVSDLPIIMARFDNVFSGREVQAAFLKGIFQISETPTTLKTGDKFGRMEVTSVGKDIIEMKNDGSISLSQNSVETLMGSVKLKVADNSDKLRFYFAVDVTPDMVANQLVIDAPSKITAGDVAIVKVTAGGAGVDGASVVLDSTDMGTTDSTGSVNYTLPKTLKGMYNITATKLGYQGATKSIEILQYVEYRLSMDAPAKVNQFETIPVKITYNGTAIPGATVMFDNTTIGTTDTNGVLNYKFDTSGMHTLTASKSGYITIAREIEVRAPYSEYRALDINITPNSTFTNREVLIRSNITNAGTKGDTLPVELKVNNSVVDNRTITLAPGEKQEINFTLKEDKPGNYTVEILGQKGILEVKEAPLNYLLIGGIITGLGAIIIYVLTAKGKISIEAIRNSMNVETMKSKLNIEHIKKLLEKSGKKGI
ncbi:S-layer protein domain-containing protein [Candidatus Methanoperedens nitratireducens]|uniref:Putative S-layer-related duplication domain protein n=1 Tax=Candidatus Methanoperedens nitratireducens TaxID=1392998 RepID=A0A284VL06_9EURY|nr:S-layer protein domain-containing protein [Candidatus Methanoperedens nitroreducens]SNQ59889.1 putative S-layer-related duplication domain protein [Candidatus Methanoperedens nitroreducens]